MSIPIAVSVGVLVAALLYLISAANDVTVRMIIRTDDGRLSEVAPPAELTSNTVTVLAIYGSLYFAGARTLMEMLPSPKGATRPAVVLRLRGRTRVGATLIDVLDDYADALANVGGRLYLSGVDEDVSVQLRRVGKLDLKQEVHIVPEDVYRRTTAEAVAQAKPGWAAPEMWIADKGRQQTSESN